MPELMWDASALSKGYFVEVGSDTANALLNALPPVASTTAYLCYAEACASLRRRLNQGALDRVSFAAARSALQAEVLLDPAFGLITITDADVLAGVSLTDQHNINSSDAAILAAFLGYARTRPVTAPTCLLIAADQRLIRAANAEGLRTLNPEAVAAADVPAVLGTL